MQYVISCNIQVYLSKRYLNSLISFVEIHVHPEGQVVVQTPICVNVILSATVVAKLSSLASISQWFGTLADGSGGIWYSYRYCKGINISSGVFHIFLLVITVTGCVFQHHVRKKLYFLINIYISIYTSASKHLECEKICVNTYIKTSYFYTSNSSHRH